MNTIHTIEDLIQLLDEKPEWADAMRARLLTRELIELPEKFTKFVAELDRFVEVANRRFDALEERIDKLFTQTDKRFTQIDNRFTQIDNRFTQIDNRFTQIDNRFTQIDNRFTQIDNRFTQIDNRFNRLEADVGQIKGILARNAALEDAALIAREMDLRRLKTLSQEDLWDLVDAADTSDIPPSDLRSFRRADLVMEAIDPAEETCYVAVEISFTVNGRDTARAIRNAGFLTRFTQRRAHAAVAGLYRDHRIRDIIESGDVFWHEMDPGILESE